MGRAGLSPVMVGRSADLDRLRSLVAGSSRPVVALIAGEAGIGKTRLVQELIGSVPAGTDVIAGQADPDTVGRPFELFLDAVRACGLAEDDLAVLRDSERTVDERVRTAVELVRGDRAPRPALVVFEDLHWSDPESLMVFERLLDPDGGPLVVLGTYRPDGLSRRHPAADLLPRLDRRHSVTHVQLGRLSPAEISDYLAAVFGRDPSFRDVDALHQRTGGNPFFLEELVASAGDVGGDGVDMAPLPWTIAELVRGQVDSLEPEVRSVVAAASVLGRRVPFDLLASVTATPEPQLIDHLRAAVDTGLLVEADADVFTFHHDLAREAIKGSLLGRERRRYHEAALAVLRAAPTIDHAALAHHAAGAGQYAEMVEHARLGAHEALAAGSTYQALRLAESGLSEADDDLDLRAVATRAAWLISLLDEADDHAERWLHTARSHDDISQEAAALAMRMRVAYDLGDLAEMDALTFALIDTLDRLPADAERATAMAAVAQSYMLRDLLEPTCEWADKAIALASEHGLDAVRRAAMVEKGAVLVIDPSSIEEAEQLLRAAADEAEAVGDHLLAAQALFNLMWKARQTGRSAEAREILDRLQGHAEAAGFDSLASRARVESRAALAVADGDLTAAITLLDEGDRMESGYALPRNRRWLGVFRAGLALEAGDVDAAAAYTEIAKPATARSRVGVVGLDVHVAARQGDVERVRSALVDLVEAIQVEGYAMPAQAHDIVTAALGAGLAPTELEPLVALTGMLPGNRFTDDQAWRQLLGAQLAEADGRLEEACGLYGAAATSEIDSTGFLARHRGTAHVGAARCLIGLGRLDEARTHAEAAAEHLARWHGWRVDELVAVQRRLGVGPDPSGPESLTPREREVAALVAEGLTNAALAERLFISPRTAAVHVSNILAKLGMASRSEVAAWAVREGLAAQ